MRLGLGLGLIGGQGPLSAPVPRVTLTGSERVGFSAHSFLAQAVDNIADAGDPFFRNTWAGGYDLGFAPYSSLKTRWDNNGVDRTGSYSNALWVTEFTNPYAGGWPAIDSAASIETLQYLYWYARMSQAKGCRVMFIYPPWSPQSVGASLDDETMSRAAFWRDWLMARPEITMQIYVMPVPVIVRRMRTYFQTPAIGPALNEAGAVSNGITINGVSVNGLDYTTTNGSVSCYGVATPPAGSIVEFDITSTGVTYFRIDQEGDMTSPNYTELVPGGIPAGTQRVSVTIPSYTNRAYIGFRSPSSAVRVQISNWKVTGAAMSPYKDGDDLHLSNLVSDAPRTSAMAAMGAGLRMMMLGARLPDDPTWSTQMRELVALVWAALAEYAFTGLGGSVNVTPTPGQNPLPSPAPLP